MNALSFLRRALTGSTSAALYLRPFGGVWGGITSWTRGIRGAQRNGTKTNQPLTRQVCLSMHTPPTPCFKMPYFEWISFDDRSRLPFDFPSAMPYMIILFVPFQLIQLL